jgi:hypothetical protein
MQRPHTGPDRGGATRDDNVGQGVRRRSAPSEKVEHINQADDEGFDPGLQDDEPDAGLTGERGDRDDAPMSCSTFGAPRR